MHEIDLENHKIPLEGILHRNQSHLAVVVDADCNGTETLLQKCAKLEYFYNTYHWLAFGSFFNVTDKFKDVELVVNADVSFTVDYHKNGNWTILDVYNPSYKNGGELIVTEVGYYNRIDGYRVPITENLYFKRKNMTGTIFKSVVVITDNITISLRQYLDNDDDRKNNTFNRFQALLIQNCQDFFNFEINQSVIASWGYQKSNGDVDGMLKELKEKRIDFGSAPLMFKGYRLKMIDYGCGTWIMKSAFLFRHPKNTASSYELYLRPLESAVWIATIIALIFILMIFKFIITKEMDVLNETDQSNIADSSWSFLVIYSIGELCQQGFSYIPVLPSGRILVITVLLFFFLIYQFYSASLVSHLLLERPRTINTLTDLLKSNLKVGCEDSLYYRDYFDTTTDPVAIQLYNRKIKQSNNHTNFFHVRKGLDKVKDGGFAFHTLLSTAYPIIDGEFPERAICELTEVKLYATQTLYTTLPKRSPLKEMLNYCMYHQREVGVLSRLRNHWDAHKPECISHTPYLEIEVGLNESYWALILLSLGIITSVILLITEIFWKRRKKKISAISLSVNSFFAEWINRSVMASWGYPQSNGDVDGMLKELKEKRIDFGSAPLMLKVYRLKIIDYGYGTWIMKSAFLFRHPKNTASSYELYLRPLESAVWIATIIALILIIMILRFIVTKEIEVLNEADESNIADSSWSFLVIYSIGELCQQGFSYIPVLPSGRIVIITVLLFFFLIYQFYSASLVSYLLLEPPRTINTLTDLLKSNFKVGCEDSLYDRDYFSSTTDPVAIQLYNKKIKQSNNHSNFFRAPKGLDKVKDGGFAFHTQTATAYPIIDSKFPEKAICELAEVKLYATQTLYVTLPKRSPLKEMFNYCMHHQREVGVINRLRNHWDAHKPECISHTPYLEIEVGLNESYWALILLEQVEIAKYLMQKGIRVSMFDVINRSFQVAEVLKNPYYHIAVVVDTDCDNVEPFLIECADNNFFYETYHWLAFGTNFNNTNTFLNVGLAINADVTVAIPNPNSKTINWTLLDVYNPSQKRGGDLKINEIGFYNQEEGYNTIKVWNKYFTRRNMTGTTFSASMVIPENISVTLEEYLDSEEERNNNTFSRFNSVTVHYCQEFYNFSMNKSIIHSWGYVQEDGDVDGLVNQLKYGTVDFGLAALLYKPFRLIVNDYGYGNWIMKSAFIFRHPKTTCSSYELYLRPLQNIVWILIIVALVLMVLVLRFVIVKESKLLHKPKNVTSVGENSWSFLIVYNIGELCQQGFSYIPVLASGRIAVFTVLLFFFLIYQFYSASIVSFLLLPPRKTIKTLPDLLKSPLKVGAENILYDIDYFKTTNDPVAIALYNTKIKQPNNQTNFLPPVEGLELVKKGGYAFHTQASTGYWIIEHMFDEKSTCELAEVQLYKPLRAHMVLAKKSPLREMFMFCNIHQMEVGVMDRLRKYWTSHPPQCADVTPYLKIQVSLSESYWALILLGFGIFSSVILLILEHMWKRFLKNMFIQENRSEKYIEQSILAVKMAIDTTYFKMITSSMKVKSEIHLAVQQFPYPPHAYKKGTHRMQRILPHTIMFGYAFLCPIILHRIVRDQRTGLKIENSEEAVENENVQLNIQIEGNIVGEAAYENENNLNVCNVLASQSYKHRRSFDTVTHEQIRYTNKPRMIENIGMLWEYVGKYDEETGNVTLSNVFTMLVVDCILYFLITMYIENIKPNRYGTTKPIIFPCQNFCNWVLTFFEHADDEEDHNEDDRQTNRFCKVMEGQPDLPVKIKIRSLVKEYKHVTAVNALSMNVFEKKVTVVTGHNGAGKTTILNVIAGITSASNGTISINNKDIKSNKKACIGYCPQDNLLFSHLTIVEHLIIFGMLRGLTKVEAEFEANELIFRLGIHLRSFNLGSRIYGGTRRKIALGIAFIGNPEIILLDEPTVGLDPESRRLIWDLILSFKEEKTFLITTHSMEEAELLGDQIAILDHGALVCLGSPSYLKQEFAVNYSLLLNYYAQSNATETEENKNDEINQSDQVQEIMKLITHIIPSAVLQSDKKNKLTISLPRDSKPLFSKLFQTLEAAKDKLDISKIDLHVETTLEDVFSRFERPLEDEVTEEEYKNKGEFLRLKKC
ncbi:hypothetical protein RN001_000149 [Aquatica leii]|uniref:ABC transporter domain-containing protein n=1 Tax=Aquatica leii TaxID=1421715 RepID=A0AAN7QLW0_9COLE|nr:hypothetical protein RN001_000149 [Aquatica leii]